jgi:hypothetical protein
MMSRNNDNNSLIISLVNKDFVPRGKRYAVSDMILDAEFKYVSRIYRSSTPFALHQTMWKHKPTYVSQGGPVDGSLEL